MMTMKRFFIKTIFLVLVYFGFMNCAFSEEEKSPLFIYLQTAAAYYPESECRSDGADFAPVTGPFSGFECAATLFVDYKFDTPLGQHWLLKDANVVVSGGVEVTPISFRPQVSASFTPVPFFKIMAGGTAGFGWNIPLAQGLCEFDEDSREYQWISTFEHPYYNLWAEANLMFDTGAIIEGDWTHVVFLGALKTFYSGIAGIDSHTPYEWQGGKNYVQGLQYEVRGIAGYQMPLVLKMAGFMYKAEGHFDGADYGDFDSAFDGDFCTITLSPVFQFNFGEKDTLFCALDFSSRRRFSVDHDKAEDEFFMKADGREWYFKRFAVNWTHYFKK